MRDKLYFFLDVESDGPVPGLDSMIELGMVCRRVDGTPVGSFGACLNPMPLVTRRSLEKDGCRDFWQKFPVVLERIRAEAVPPPSAMYAFANWMAKIQLQENVSRGLVCVADPAAFDYPFLRYYWEFYLPQSHNPFEQRCFDVRSWFAGTTMRPYLQSGKRGMKQAGVRWSSPHTHRAVEDAQELAERFFAARDAEIALRENYTTTSEADAKRD